MKNVFTLIVICGAVLTLAFLGTWQVQRLQWKNQIIDNLNAEYQKDPAQNIYSKNDLTIQSDEENPILFGSIQGNFMTVSPIFLRPKTNEGTVGAHVIHPLSLKKGGTIFVNRGWIDEQEIKEFNSSVTTINVTGIFRRPDWNRFTSNNSPAQNIWTKADINEMAEFYEIKDIVPVMLYATDIKNNNGLVLQDKKWYPRSKHLQYALFWYGMIFVLLILVGFAFKSSNKSVSRS